MIIWNTNGGKFYNVKFMVKKSAFDFVRGSGILKKRKRKKRKKKRKKRKKREKRKEKRSKKKLRISPNHTINTCFGMQVLIDDINHEMPWLKVLFY